MNWEERAIKAEEKLQRYEMVVSYAEDVVKSFPKLSLKTISAMKFMVQGLAEALSELKG